MMALVFQSHPPSRRASPSVGAGHGSIDLLGLGGHVQAALADRPPGGGQPGVLVEGHQWDLAGLPPVSYPNECPHHNMGVGAALVSTATSRFNAAICGKS